MQRKSTAKKMTLDRLASSMQRELLGIGRKYDRLDDKISGVDQRMTSLEQKIVGLDQKIDRIPGEIVDEVRKENVKVIEANDRVATKLDRLLEDAAAHDALHKRLENSVHNHEVRIKKLEQVRR